MNRTHGSRRVWLAAGAFAVLLHLAVFAANPEFEVDWSTFPKEKRPFELRVSSLQYPTPNLRLDRQGYVPLNDVERVPRIKNLPMVWAKMPRIWSGGLWTYRSEGSADFEIWIRWNGTVKDAFYVDGHDDPATRQGLLKIVRLLRFDPSQVNGDPTGVVARIQVSVESLEAGWRYLEAVQAQRNRRR